MTARRWSRLPGRRLSGCAARRSFAPLAFAPLAMRRQHACAFAVCRIMSKNLGDALVETHLLFGGEESGGLHGAAVVGVAPCFVNENQVTLKVPTFHFIQ